MSATYRRQIERLFAHSAFYREKLRAAGFDSPAAVGGIENIAALPFTEKDKLRKSQAEHPPLGAHAAIDISQAARIYSTSGTSGMPLYIPLTKSDVEDWRRIGRDTYSKNGLKAGERVVTTYGAGPFVAGASLAALDRKSTRLNSSHGYISYAVFCLKKKKTHAQREQTPLGRKRLESHHA